MDVTVELKFIRMRCHNKSNLGNQYNMPRKCNKIPLHLSNASRSLIHLEIDTIARSNPWLEE